MDAKEVQSRWDRIPHTMRLGLAVLLVQLIFWLLIKPMIIGSPTAELGTIDGYNYQQAKLEAPTYTAVTSAEFEAIDALPAWHCCERGYRALRYSFDLDTVPQRGLGIEPYVRADNFAVYVNGTFVGGTGRMELPDHTFDSLYRETYHIPRDILNNGANQTTIIMVRDGIPYFDYFAPIMGEYSQLHADLAKTRFLNNGYYYLVIAGVAMVALFSLIFFFISGREGVAFWTFILATSLAALSHYYVWSDPPFGGQTRIAYYFAVNLLVQFAWLGWANAWSRDRYAWILPLGAAGFVASLIASLYCFYALPYGPGYDRAGEIVVYSGLFFIAATAARLIWNFRDMREDRYWEAAIALLLVSLLAMQLITELTEALNLAYVSRTQPFLIVGIAVAFFARRVRLFRTSAQISGLLQAQLDQRTGELAKAHDREKRLVRQQALDEERQRIMRDMHDGLGSHLMSMMMMAKRGNGKHADFADGLQSVVDEMRLMIDSMDSVGESLRAALTVFRKRIVPRAREAGFGVTWNETSEAEYPDYNPREVLQVFRILQEAITNALKHSGGDEIKVSVKQALDSDGALEIAITDNGEGISVDPRGGRGLKNMGARANGIGAELDIQSGDEGTAVLLKLSNRA